MRTNTINYTDFLHRIPGAEDKGRYIVALCPFHNDSTPSLLIFPDGFFHCLAASCSRSGTWKDLLSQVSGQPVRIQVEKRIHYSSPARLLEQDFGDRETGAYQSYLHLAQFSTFQYYLEIRGLTDAIDIHELGYHRGWYTIPVRDSEYKFQNVIFRAAPHVQFALDGVRYWADGKPSMYVPDWHLLDKGDYIIMVFGIMDALTLNKFRYPVVTPTHGHTFDPNWLNAYRKPIYVIPDRGEERAALKLVSGMGWRGKMVRLEYPTGMKDANDFLKGGREKELLAQLEQVTR
jgi:DNA primase